MLATALALAVAASAAAAQPGPVAIDFGVSATNRDQHAARTAGTFIMTGRFADAGTVSIAYRLVGPRIDGTATLIGTRGIFTIGLHGAFGGIVDDRQSAAGGRASAAVEACTSAWAAVGTGRLSPTSAPRPRA